MSVRGLAKRIVNQLPAAVRHEIRARYYWRRLRGITDFPERTLIATVLRPGEVAVDVGANFGLVTKAMAEMVGPAGRVIAVEPMPESSIPLERNMRRLKLMHVTVVHSAIADRIGTAHMTTPADNLYLAHLADSGTPVAVTTLDALTAPVGRVAFIKCDVEGHEVEVLRGAHRLLTTDRPTWLVENWGGALFEVFARYRYTASWYDGATIRPLQPGDNPGDVLFRPE